MRPERTLQTFHLQDIDLANQEFRISFGRPFPRLRQSIRSHGIIDPPLVYYPPLKQTCQVVTGFRRLEFAAELGIHEVACLLITEETPGEDLLLLSFHEHVGKRELNEAEKAIILSKLDNIFSREEVVGGFLPLLGLEPSVTVLNGYLQLAGLEKNILLALAEKQLDKNTALELSRVEEESRKRLTNILIALKCSASIQKEIVVNVIEIAIREQKAIPDILEEPELQQIIDSGDLNRRQKANHVRRYLRKRRYPILTQHENEFKEKLEALNLPGGIAIKPPPYFEGERWQAEIAFKDPDHLKKKLIRLKKLIESEKLHTLGNWE